MPDSAARAAAREAITKWLVTDLPPEESRDRLVELMADLFTDGFRAGVEAAAGLAETFDQPLPSHPLAVYSAAYSRSLAAAIRALEGPR